MKKRIITGLALILTVCNIFAWAHNSTAGSSVSMATLGIFATLKKSNGEEFGEAEKEMFGAIEKLISEGFKNKMSKEDVDQAIDKLKSEFPTQIKQESIDAITETLKNQAAELEALKEKGVQVNPAKESVAKLINDALATKENAEALKQLRLNRKGSLSVVVKAAVNVGADTLQQTAYLPGINYAPQEENRISSFINVITDNRESSTLTYSEEYDPSGAAAVVGLGGLKPLVGAKYRQVTSNPEKIAAHIKECDDLLLYIPALQGQMQSLLMRKLEDARDAAIVTMIDTAAAVYNLTGISTTNPNKKDAIRGSIAQCRSLNYKPTHVFLNPIDTANFEMDKGDDGHYIHVYTAAPNALPVISTLQVIETNQIPLGSFCVGDMSKVNIRYITDIYFRFAYGITVDGDTSDDNVHDIITIIAEQHVNKFIKSLDGGAFVYDTFNNVIGAI